MIEAARARLTALLKRAIKDGELSRSLSLDAATAMLIGPMLYHEIFGGIQTFPPDLAEQVVHAFWRAFRPAPTKRHPATRHGGVKRSGLHGDERSFALCFCIILRHISPVIVVGRFGLHEICPGSLAVARFQCVRSSATNPWRHM